MTIDELWPHIVAAGREHDYVLRAAAMPAHQPSSATVVEPAADGSGRWVVYFSERGEILDPHHFDDEDAACQAVLLDLRRPENPKHTQTARERTIADERNVEAEQLRRQLLADLGRDQDTGT